MLLSDMRVEEGNILLHIRCAKSSKPNSSFNALQELRASQVEMRKRSFLKNTNLRELEPSHFMVFIIQSASPAWASALARIGSNSCHLAKSFLFLRSK